LRMSYLVLLRKVPSFNIYIELGNARYDHKCSRYNNLLRSILYILKCKSVAVRPSGVGTGLSQFSSILLCSKRQFLFDTAVFKTIQTGNAVLLGSSSHDLFLGSFNPYFSSVILRLGSESDEEDKEDSYERFHVLRFIYIKRKHMQLTGLPFAEKPLFFGIWQDVRSTNRNHR